MAEEGQIKVEDEAAHNAMAVTTVKTPAFSEASTTTWFKILDAQFTLRKITSPHTRFCHAISELPVSVLDKVSIEVMEAEDYDLLRAAVVAFYERSKPELFEKLMSSTVMTGRPSSYLREMEQVAAKVGFGEEFIRHKFLQALPSSISPALATQQDLTLSQLGSMADELIPLSKQINIVSKHEQRNSRSEQRNFRSEQRNSRSSSRSTNQVIPYGLRPYRDNQRQTICRAHIYYNDAARNCKAWCKYPNKSGCRILPNSRSTSPVPVAKQGN